jgi:hypothetical protein
MQSQNFQEAIEIARADPHIEEGVDVLTVQIEVSLANSRE